MEQFAVRTPLKYAQLFAFALFYRPVLTLIYLTVFICMILFNSLYYPVQTTANKMTWIIVIFRTYIVFFIGTAARGILMGHFMFIATKCILIGKYQIPYFCASKLYDNEVMYNLCLGSLICSLASMVVCICTNFTVWTHWIAHCILW